MSLALYDKMCLSSCDGMHVSDTIGRCMWHSACFDSTAYESGKLTASLDDLVWSIAGGAWLCMFVSLYTFKKWNISFGSVSEAVSQLRLSEAGGDC